MLEHYEAKQGNGYQQSQSEAVPVEGGPATDVPQQMLRDPAATLVRLESQYCFIIF